MPAFSTAQPPTAYITSIPGRYAPPWLVNKVGPGSITTSTTTTDAHTFLPRAESVGMDFSTPTTPVTELGTAWNVGEYDSLPDSKVTVSSYAVGCANLALVCNKAISQVSSATTLFQYSDLAEATNDLVVQYADPNGNIFYSEYMPDLLVDSYGINVKAKSAAMESYDFVGPAQLGFRGYFITKYYVVQSGDASSNGFTIAAIMGSREQPVAFPVPGGGTPGNFWTQRGCINYVKVDRWRSGQAWLRYSEVPSGPVLGVSCHATIAGAFTFAAGDLVTGDLFAITYASYGCNVVGYQAIPNGTIDSSDPIAVDARLTPIDINGGSIWRGSALDIKMSLKRNRVEGIGDTFALYGPPEQPSASVSLDVAFTGGYLDTLIRTGSLYGTDGGGSTTGDFIDANYETRLMLNTPTPILASIYDPRATTKTVMAVDVPSAVFKQRSLSQSSKSDVTLKFSGSDQIGNIAVGVVANGGTAPNFSGVV